MLRFTKMHGAGNDFVVVDLWNESIPAELSDLARRLTDRHTGVGADGLILVGPSPVADARMRIFNPDGSEAEMCGNGLRCVARYLVERRGIPSNPLRVETARGVLEATVLRQDGRPILVRTSLGPPRFHPDEIPTSLPGPPDDRPLSDDRPLTAETPLCDVPLTIDGAERRLTVVGMGNPHAVLFVERLDDSLVRTVGPALERHSAFPQRTNVEFVRVVSRHELEIRVWERGAGETQACGTGAAAAVVASALTGRTNRRATCRLPGGALEVYWTETGEVLLTGPAEEVFSGAIPAI